jgi:transposase InsO family protein
MLQLARARPRSGDRTIGGLLALEGWRAGMSRVFRLWQREGLKVRQKNRRRRRLGASANRCHRRRAESPNDVWCWDFIFDRTSSGSQLKWLAVIDEFTRKSLTLKADRGITSDDVVDALVELLAMRGVPKHIRSDNGPEFTANELRTWLGRIGVSTLYIEPGSPWVNGVAESFHSRFRDECLALEVLTASAPPGQSRQPGRTTTTTGGLTALLVFRPRPGSPPRVRHPPRTRPLFCRTRGCLPGSRPTPNPHIAWYKKPKPVKGTGLCETAALQPRRQKARIPFPKRLTRPLQPRPPPHY